MHMICICLKEITSISPPVVFVDLLRVLRLLNRFQPAEVGFNPTTRWPGHPAVREMTVLQADPVARVPT